MAVYFNLNTMLFTMPAFLYAPGLDLCTHFSVNS